MTIQFKMKNLQEFVPVHGDPVIVFYHERFYSRVEMLQMQVEFTYQMIDGDGCPVPQWACYDGREDIPFDRPFVWKDGQVKYLSVEECKEIHSRHPKHHYRYWWIKDWFLSGSGNDQLNREQLADLSLGIMSAKEFSDELDKNCLTIEADRIARQLEIDSRTGRCDKHGTRQLGKDQCDLCRIEGFNFANTISMPEVFHTDHITVGKPSPVYDAESVDKLLMSLGYSPIRK